MRRLVWCGLLLGVASLGWVPQPATAAGAVRGGGGRGGSAVGLARLSAAPAHALGAATTRGTTTGVSGAAAVALGVFSPPPPVTTQPTPPTPGSATAAPLAPLPPPAPLAPQLQTQFSSGGVPTPGLALSPGGTSTPSTPGGGGETLQDCMNFWERATHMSKAEWRPACMRTLRGLENADAGLGASQATGNPTP